MRGGRWAAWLAGMNAWRGWCPFLLSAAVPMAVAGDFPPPHDSEKDLRVPLMPAAEAAARFEVPPGVTASVVACEPVLRNPIAMAWDGRGRLWVAENFTYAERGVRLDERLRDRVLVFDLPADGGPAAAPRVFLDDARQLTGLAPARGGLYLLCPPDLLFVPDKNADDVPDGAPEVVLDGFTVARENHHNFANGLRHGPDGWLYGRCGHSCPGRLGTPGTPDAERVPIEGGIWRWHPVRRTVEVLAHGTTNPWGHDWDAHGELFFINTVNGHLWHMIQGAHFRESFGADPNPMVFHRLDMHADHWHFDTGKGWQASRDGKADDLGGGHAHIGMMICQGLGWPGPWEGRLLTFNMHGRRLNVERLERHGSGYIGRHEPDSFRAADPWFRGIDLTAGPDGAVYAIDWSDTGECHDHTGVHRGSGRLFRFAGRPVPGIPPADLAGRDPGLVERILTHPNPWFERRFREGLAPDSLTAASRAALRAGLTGKAPAAQRLRALWILHADGTADDALLGACLDDPDEHVRTWAIRLLSDTWPIDDADGRARAVAAPDPALLARFTAMAARDGSGLVRLALASLLQRLPPASRPGLAAALLAHAEDAADHNQPAVVWTGLTPLAFSHPDRLAALAAAGTWPSVAEWTARALALRSGASPGALDALLAAAAGRPAAVRLSVLRGLADGFRGWRKAAPPPSWPAFAASCRDLPDALPLRTRLDALFGGGVSLTELQAMAADRSADPAARRAALESLVAADPAAARPLCTDLLTVRELAPAALRGLAGLDDPAIAPLILQRFPRFADDARAVAMETLVSRSAWASSLLDSIASGVLPRHSLAAAHARQIRELGDKSLTEKLAAVWGESRETPAERRRQMDSLAATLTPQRLAAADLPHGRLLFKGLCASCHRLHGDGALVGPDLTGSGRRQLDYLLLNLLDPSAEVAADYRLLTLRLKDGRTVAGVVAARDERTLTLRSPAGETVLERAAIAAESPSPLSLMPEGLLAGLAEHDVRDLLAYLMHPVQVPLPEAP